MKSCTKILSEKYFELLENIAPTFYEMVPDETPSPYIVVQSINHSPDKDYHTFNSNTSVTVIIHTESLKYSDGVEVDNLENDVMEALMPTPNATLDLGNDFEMCGLELSSANTQKWQDQQGYAVIEKILIFNQLVTQLPSILN